MAKEFAAKKRLLTMTANKISKSYGITLRGQIGFFGSFVSYRINDLEGEVSMRQAWNIKSLLADMLEMNEIKIDRSSGDPTYHMGGIVYTWIRK